MRTPQFACHAITWRWVNGDLPDVLECIANLGFDGTELPSEFFLSSETPYDSIQKSFNKHGLPVISVYHTARLGALELFLRRYEIEKCVALLNLLQSFGIGYLIVGDPPSGFMDSIDKLAESLEYLGGIAKNNGITLCYHPHRGSIVESPTQIDNLLKLTSQDHVSLCLDTGHIYWSGGEPIEVLRQFNNRIGYLHFKDVRKKPFNIIEKLIKIVNSIPVQIDIATKVKCLGFILLENNGPIITEIGKGDLDFTSITKELDRMGYAGWVTIELDTPTLNPEMALRRCLLHVSNQQRHNVN